MVALLRIKSQAIVDFKGNKSIWFLCVHISRKHILEGILLDRTNRFRELGAGRCQLKSL